MEIRPEQYVLHESLERRSAKLARIYLGGLRVLADLDNPTRYELAAHSMRELIEKSPLLTNAQPTGRGDSMKSRLQPVKEAFFVMTTGGRFDGKMDLTALGGPIRLLIDRLDNFFKWESPKQAEARTRTAEMLSALAGAGPRLPNDIVEAEIEGWMGANAYFQAVSHNGREADHETFRSHMSFVESLLLRRLQPQSIAQLNELDALIREGEGA